MIDADINGHDAFVDIADVEMKEEDAALEPTLDSIQQAPQAANEQPTPLESDPSAPIATESAADASSLQQAASASTPQPPQAGAARVSVPPQPAARPKEPVAHGGPTRQFLNTHVTPHLLEGMKYLAVHEPQKPLQWLADFLRDRSKEVEGP